MECLEEYLVEFICKKLDSTVRNNPYNLEGHMRDFELKERTLYDFDQTKMKSSSPNRESTERNT